MDASLRHGVPEPLTAPRYQGLEVREVEGLIRSWWPWRCSCLEATKNQITRHASEASKIIPVPKKMQLQHTSLEVSLKGTLWKHLLLKVSWSDARLRMWSSKMLLSDFNYSEDYLKEQFIALQSIALKSLSSPLWFTLQSVNYDGLNKKAHCSPLKVTAAEIWSNIKHLGFKTKHNPQWGLQGGKEKIWPYISS